jgi:hypothetical protein
MPLVGRRIFRSGSISLGFTRFNFRPSCIADCRVDRLRNPFRSFGIDRGDRCGFLLSQFRF